MIWNCLVSGIRGLLAHQAQAEMIRLVLVLVAKEVTFGRENLAYFQLISGAALRKSWTN